MEEPGILSKTGVLPSSKEHNAPSDAATVFKKYDKNKTGAIEVRFDK
jgi:hypothetical protein